ncbi:MAG: hypothetical protein WCA82_06985 [Jiangellales bacterium]
MGVLDRVMSGAYFRWAYHPAAVPAPPTGLPVEHHVASVPWIVEDKPVCQSVAVQMIAAHHGVHRSRAEIDFLMGFTYGAGYRADWGFLTVGVDPETGIATAAPFLGLMTRYHTTNDADRFVAALKAGLTTGHPVRVPLDMATLYGQGEPLPHNEVLVGFDPAGFFYYEPISLPPSPCPPGRRPPGQRGLYVEADHLLAAVRRQTEMFGYPWRYALVSFAPAPTQTDLTPIWRKNGHALVGGSRWGQRWGAAATEHVAGLIDEVAGPVGLAERGVLLGMVTRPDNAAYLRRAHPEIPDINHAADDFDQAAAAYQATHAILSAEPNPSGARHQVAQHLREAATAERHAGQRFLHHASRPIPATPLPATPA